VLKALGFCPDHYSDLHQTVYWFFSNKSYIRGFKANKQYAKRHNALMFVHEGGPCGWTKLHFAVWKDELTALKGYVEVGQKLHNFMCPIYY
jgi:hypothetical protein